MWKYDDIVTVSLIDFDNVAERTSRPLTSGLFTVFALCLTL